MNSAAPSEPLPGDDTHRAPPWMISFVDLVSLLLSFMILASACSRLEGQAWIRAAGAIRTAFGGPAWMTPDALPQPMLEAAPALPACDLGYLALLLDHNLGAGASGVDNRLENDRLRITASPAGSDGKWTDADRQSRLRQLGELLAKVGNDVRIEVHILPGASAGVGPSVAQWEAALNDGVDVAAALVDAGVPPTRLAVFSAAVPASIPTADSLAATSPASPGQTSTLVRTEIVVLNHGGRP